MSTTTTGTINEDMNDEPSANSFHLLKSEMAEFQCVLATVAFESITDDVSATNMQERISLFVLGNDFQGTASQIKVLLQGTNHRSFINLIPL